MTADIKIIRDSLNEAINEHCFHETPFHQMLVSALAALTRLEASSNGGWRGIAEAPRDGTEVLGCSYKIWSEDQKPIIDGPCTMSFERGKWRSSWGGSEVLSYMSDFGSDYKDLDFEPTHWRPLPPPPETGGER